MTWSGINKQSSVARSLSRIGIGIAIGLALGLSGCSIATSAVGDPAGSVALAERHLLWEAFAIMMIVALPVFAMTAWVAIHYRASNNDARYAPEWSESAVIESAVWLVPSLMVLAISYLVWSGTHSLDPYRQLDTGSAAPLRIQAIAQDWRWLFIYPDQDVASVNELAIEAGRPVTIDITSDTVMNALYIPRLAGQIYAMAGMRTKLNLQADHTGRFTGRNSQYSGSGFSDQRFRVVSLSKKRFGAWIAKAKGAAKPLDIAIYEKLAGHRSVSPVAHYSSVEPGLFERVIAKHSTKASRANAIHSALRCSNLKPPVASHTPGGVPSCSAN